MAISCTSSVIWASPRPAFLRIGIGVEPVWLSLPVTVHWIQRRPWPWVTTPMSLPSASRIGPCSMCSSKSACILRLPPPRRPSSRCAPARRRSACPWRRAVIGPVLVVHAGKDARGQHGRGKARAFLVGPVDHHDGVLGLDVEIVERAHQFQTRQHAEHAVILAAGGLGVEVRADIDGKRVGIGARAAHEHVAHGVDAHGEPRPVRTIAGTAAAFAVLVGQGLAVVAAGDAGADLGHLHQRVPQPVPLMRRFAAGADMVVSYFSSTSTKLIGACPPH
jgi:hypothetical protein